jgi:hypothetical protein
VYSSTQLAALSNFNFALQIENASALQLDAITHQATNDLSATPRGLERAKHSLAKALGGNRVLRCPFSHKKHNEEGSRPADVAASPAYIRKGFVIHVGNTDESNPHSLAHIDCSQCW